MAETDSPLKILVREFAPDFAAWLLRVDSIAIRHVQVLNIELPAGRVSSDTILRVTLASGHDVLLHVEFQGKDSERPMPWRMVDYLGRIAERELNYRRLEDLPLCGVVFYVGEGAGAHDFGDYHIGCPDGGLTLAWRYRAIRLWQMPAEELLALKRPALLTLIGQTRIEEPTHVVPQAVAAIKQVPDPEIRGRLFGALISLMRDEEILTMTEQMIETLERDPLLNTPFLRRIRDEGRDEGRVALRQSILDTLMVRFDPPITRYRRIETQLAETADLGQLQKFLLAVLRASDVADFEQALAR